MKEALSEKGSVPSVSFDYLFADESASSAPLAGKNPARPHVEPSSDADVTNSQALPDDLREETLRPSSALEDGDDTNDGEGTDGREEGNAKGTRDGKSPTTHAGRGARPTVTAVRCPDEHLSPPLATHCRSCRREISNRAIVAAPRPPLGTLVLSTGARIVLDQDLILGRAPRDPGLQGEKPALITIRTATTDVSRTHAGIRLEEWSVLVVDLGSTNGTFVVPPQAPCIKLQANEPTLIEPGTTVSLAGEVSFAYTVET